MPHAALESTDNQLYNTAMFRLPVRATGISSGQYLDRLLRTIKFILCVLCLSALPAWGDGHGPAFGYSTTLLGLGDSSVESSFMWRSGTAMIGTQYSYGWKQNLQLSITAPFHLDHGDHPVGRFSATMPGVPELEGLLAWRFHHSLTGVGTRNETTAYIGGAFTTQAVPRIDGPPLERQPSIYGAIATGHISRSYYLWAGAGYQHYSRWSNAKLDHESDSLLTSFVVGWRPSFLNGDYPKPDLRFFWETTGDRIGPAWRDALELTAAGDGGHDHGTPTPSPPANSNGIINLPNSGGTGISGTHVPWHIPQYGFPDGDFVPAFGSAERHATG